MSNVHRHLSEERFQALLDGELPPEVATGLRAEIDACARCSSEFEAWQLLFEDLQDLPVLAPSATFSTRIMNSLPEPRKRSVTGWATKPAKVIQHISSAALQDFLEGNLAARSMRQVEGHLDRCAVCRTELEEHRMVQSALFDLPRFEPSYEFAERVMAELRIQQMAQLATAPVTRRERTVAWLRQMAPTSRQGWAAAMGVLVTPATMLVLMVRAVFSNELVTFSNLGAFAWLKVSDVFGGAFGGVRDALLSNEIIAQGVAFLQNAGFGSAVIAGSGTALVAMTMAAIWIVYRYVIHTPENSYARLSF